MTAFEGQAQTAEFLLKAGADVNARAEDGSSTLMLAIGNGHQHLVELLLQHGAEDVG